VSGASGVEDKTFCNAHPRDQPQQKEQRDFAPLARIAAATKLLPLAHSIYRSGEPFRAPTKEVSCLTGIAASDSDGASRVRTPVLSAPYGQ